MMTNCTSNYTVVCFANAYDRQTFSWRNADGRRIRRIYDKGTVEQSATS